MRLILGNVSCEGHKENRRVKELLNGPHIIVTMTPSPLSLKMELQADKFLEFDLIPWLLSDIYFPLTAIYLSSLLSHNQTMI